VRNGIIRIQTTTCDERGVGTGFLVGPRLVGTVEHVVEGAASIVLTRNGKALGSAQVIGEDPARDLALLETKKPVSGYRFRLGSRSPRLAEQVVALGFPFRLPLLAGSSAPSTSPSPDYAPNSSGEDSLSAGQSALRTRSASPIGGTQRIQPNVCGLRRTRRVPRRPTVAQASGRA
jgi:hypothetical protein